MVKLSIIVPIYNIEQYLRKCVNSLLDQDLSSSEYEIILVNDGSPDGCPRICDEYAAVHPNVHVIHRENGGLSAARNSGIEVAKGEYVMFVDSDDYIEPNVLKGLLSQMNRDNLDVLRYRLQYVRIKNEGVNELKNEREYVIYNPYKSDPFKGNDYSEIPTDGVSFLNSRMSTACYAWAFIIKQSLIYNDEMSRANALNEPHTLNDACLFKEGIYFEDTDWTPRMLCRARRVASTNTIVYNYLVREGSITNAVNRSKQKKVLDDKMRLVKEMQRQATELGQKGLSNVWYERMIAATVVSVVGMLSTDFYAERKEYLERLYQLNIFPIAGNSAKLRLINLSPRLAVEILHIKNR